MPFLSLSVFEVAQPNLDPPTLDAERTLSMADLRVSSVLADQAASPETLGKLVEPQGQRSNRGGTGSTLGELVEPRGIEPLTSSLRTTRSPN